MLRKIREDEIPAERDRYLAKYPWAGEPNWASVMVLTNKNDKVVGMAEVQVRPLVASLDADRPADVKALVDAIDGYLAGAGISQYEFIVPNQNEKFQRMIDKHYGYTSVEELPSRVYFVRRGK